MLDIGLKIWEFVVSIFSYFGKRREEQQENKKKASEVITSIITQLKELLYVLDEFDNDTIGDKLNEFRFQIGIYKTKISSFAALAFAQNLEIHKEFEELRNILKNILDLQLYMDGGKSWGQLCGIVNDAKQKVGNMIKEFQKVKK